MGDLDRLKQSLAGFIRTVMNRVDYLALYPAKVVSQNADGTLELQPDDARLPGLSAVPIRLGIPGAVVKVAAGARVLVGFGAGDPGQPVATLWESGSVTELDLSATSIVLNSGTHAIARQTDTVSAATTMATWIASVTSFINGLTPGTCTPPTDFGSVTSGNSSVKA